VHLNRINIQTHFVGIPLIIWAITILLSISTFDVTLGNITFSYTPAIIFFLVSLLYYFKLHINLAFGMVIYICVNLYLASLISPMEHAVSIAIAIFVIGWIIQFIGHYYEKAKPAFFDDIMGLIIGPLFLMAELYFILGLEKQLDERIKPMAIDKRRAIERANQN